jgi:hypothetical protein
MPYMHLDLPGTYPVAVKRELATRLCKLYAEVMETQSWRPNFRRGRPAEMRLALGRAIVDICVELLGVSRRTVLVEFTPHTGDEMLRDGNWVADWTPNEAVAG